MYQKIKAKFKANPTIFYACSIVASWAGVGSLMNFRTLAINNGAAAAIIWAVFNSRQRLQPQQGQRGKPEAAYPVYPDQRLDTAHRGTP